MQKAIFIGLLATSLAAPLSAYAQSSSAPAPTAAPTATDQLITIRPAQWLAVGAGFVAGAIVVDALVPTELGYLVGGVLGGYLANVWYTGHQLEIHLGTVPKT
jgi:hypothetical protein